MPNDLHPKTMHKGGCLCGRVQYAAAGDPQRVTHCYCRFCQRATGSTHMLEPIWSIDAFTITSGEPKIFALNSEGSGKEVRIHFCGECGTKLYLGFERFPDVVGIYGGTLDDPAAGARGVEQACIFLDEAIEGSVIPAGMSAWRRHRLSNDGHPIAPMRLTEPMVV